MAVQLGEYVVYGELRNTSHYTVHGILVLRGEAPGEETVLRLDLTGNPDSDLRGKTFRFEPGEADGPVFRAKDHGGLHTMQVGPTGAMTAQGWVRALPRPAEGPRAGDAAPAWARRLYLEWYGQNGRVVVEMAGPRVEQCVRPGIDNDDDGEWVPLPHTAPLPDADGALPAAGPEFAAAGADGGAARVEPWTPRPAECEEGEPGPGPYQQYLDREAAIEEVFDGDDDPDDEDALREMELMDYCIEHSVEKPLGSLVGDAETLPPPDNLDDAAVEAALKVVLARLALLGVALDVCKHYGPRDCYRLLRDQILSESGAYEELIGTGWVQHLCTYEYCPQCEAEFDAERPSQESPEPES